ncbi:DUF4062 domain-containing protein [Thiomicrorhabdus cannonii]|uniref:DUF4062 domain-containing protein n=1 Tax=Thiomicrorhabdus cannonii TaxID=2748011 RepID=UPI0015B9B6DC|nr:DUF4062 domain-containing protein [Thiomicrorhabdus cannonii]
MALLKTAVFLASRFSEFESLRSKLNLLITNYPHLQMTALDLNNGSVSHRPPLKECLGYVKQSEFMILLIGDSYGTLAPDSNESFTHLEYLEAIKEENNTRVLVFGIGSCYSGNRMHYSDDPKLAAWQRQVEENHTIGFFEQGICENEIAEEIFRKLLAAIYEKHFGALSLAETSGEFSSLDEDLAEFVLDDADIEKLEERNFIEPLLVDDPIELRDTLSAISNPAYVTAIEQRKEAKNAMDIGEYAIAVKHLKKALDVRPLDLISNYWLAQLYIAMDKKSLANESIDLSLRAAKIANQNNLPYRASASYMVAAKAANLAGRNQDAIEFAKSAVEVAPKFSRAYIGLARQYVLSGAFNEAVDSIKKAFDIYPRSLSEASGDPVFQLIRPQIKQMVESLKERLGSDLISLNQVGKQLAGIENSKWAEQRSGSSSLPSIIRACKNTIKAQQEIVKRLAVKANRDLAAVDETAQELPIEHEKFVFHSVKAEAYISEWYIHEGDVVRPGDKICTISFVRSTKKIDWFHRGRDSRRVIKLAGREDKLSVASPTIYSFVPAKLQIKPLSGVLNFEKKIQEINGKISQLQRDKEQILQKKENIPQNIFLTLPPLLWFVLLGVVLIISMKYGVFGSIIFTILIIVTLIGVGKHLDGKREERIGKQLSPLNEEERMLRLEVIGYENQIVALHNQAEISAQNAQKALKIFETTSLAKQFNLSPFKSLASGEAGDVIRLFKKTSQSLSDIKLREVIIVEDLPAWLRYRGYEQSLTHLYKIEKVEGRKVFLSPLAVYID